MLEYLDKGGPIMLLILACSVTAGAIFLERMTYYHRATIRVGEFMRGLSSMLAHGRLAEAMQECAGTPGPVSRVIHAAILRAELPRAEMSAVVQEAGQLEVPRLERRLGLLLTVIYLTPLLGLMGTVMGLLQAFEKVSQLSGFASSPEIAGGIYQSLLTTAASLMVTLIAVSLYGFLNSRVNHLLRDMERAGIEIVNLLCDQRRPSGVVKFPQPQAVTARQVNDE